MSEFRLDSLKLDYLLTNIDEGGLKLPSFQRDFKWKPSQIIKLLDSIQKSHPSGSLLFLEVNPRRKLIHDEPFRFSNARDEDIADYLVLDGQQRLTSCFCVFHNKGEKSFYLHLMKLFNHIKETNENSIDFESFVVVKKNEIHPDQHLGAHLLPMSFLKSKDIMRQKLVSYKQNLRENSFDNEYISFLEAKLEGLLDPFFDYRFPVIILPKTLDLDAVCKVFQTINTTGLKLSAFDICVAKFMANGLDLKYKIKEACINHPSLVPLLNSDETVVLQTIALLSDKSPKKNKLADNLTADNINLWNKAIEGLDETVELLSKIGVGCDKDLSLLPYHPSIPVIAAVLVDRDYSNLHLTSQSQISEKIKKWFYSVSLNLRYTEGTDNKMKEDFQALRLWIINSSEPDYIKNPIRWNPELIIKSNKSGAVGKAILCALNLSQPRDLYTERQVGVGRFIVDSQLHHIFPKAKYPEHNTFLNSVFNFTFLSPESNNFIKDKNTSYYAKEIMSIRNISKANFKDILRHHLIDEVTYTSLITEEFLSFLKNRADTVRKYLVEVVGLNIKVDSADTEGEEDLDLDDVYNLASE